MSNLGKEHSILTSYFMAVAIKLTFCPNDEMVCQILISMKEHLDEDLYSKTIERFRMDTKKFP